MTSEIEKLVLEELRAMQRILNGHTRSYFNLHDDVLKLRRGQLEAEQRDPLRERIERIERRLDIEG
jgi:hypothetical protein